MFDEAGLKTVQDFQQWQDRYMNGIAAALNACDSAAIRKALLLFVPGQELLRNIMRHARTDARQLEEKFRIKSPSSIGRVLGISRAVACRHWKTIVKVLNKKENSLLGLQPKQAGRLGVRVQQKGAQVCPDCGAPDAGEADSCPACGFNLYLAESIERMKRAGKRTLTVSRPDDD